MGAVSFPTVLSVNAQTTNSNNNGLRFDCIAELYWVQDFHIMQWILKMEGFLENKKYI